jgi:adenylate cyclase
MKTQALKNASSSSLTKLEQRLHLSDFLLKLSNQMSAFGNLDDVLNAFVEIATRELNAERGTIFLNDPTTNELYSRVAQGHLRHEIRILNSSGIAGSVFTAQESLIILEPYADPRFNQTIDEQTGFVTRSILCVPIRAGNGEVIGVDRCGDLFVERTGVTDARGATVSHGVEAEVFQIPVETGLLVVVGHHL